MPEPQKLGSLGGSTYTVAPDVRTSEVADHLKANPELPGAIVAVGPRLLGVASREAIAQCLSRPFGQELYLRKPIEELLAEVPQPLVFDEPEDLQTPVQTGLAREAEARYEPIVCRLDDGSFRLIHFHSLLLAQSELLAEASEIIKAQKDMAEAASAAKTQFLANMSHEIRTPLTAILGFAEELRNPGIDAGEHSQAVGTILRQGEHLLEVINGILDLSKIEAGRLEIERLWHAPIDLARDCIQFLRSRADAKGLSLSLSLESKVPSQILSDPTRLRQILINLIGNALKFTDRGGVELRLEFKPDKEKPLLIFHVADSGIGLTEEQIQRLFQPFVQADNSMARRYGGTGLGLSICQRLSAMLGGGIDITSQPGTGSTFSVSVSCGPMEGIQFVEELEHESKSELTPHETFEGRISGRILLAEDSPDNQLLLSRFLTRAGASVDVADNGVVAVEHVQRAVRDKKPYNLVLMDMQMPRMDGYSATRKLRELGFDLPIIALTANAMDGDEKRCREAGCTGYATKPIDRSDLISKIVPHASSGEEPAAKVRPIQVDSKPVAAITAGDSFELDAALDRLGGDRELLFEVMELVITEIPRRLDEADEGLKNDDEKLLKRAIHSLKNSAGNVGAKQTEAMALALEKKISNGGVDKATMSKYVSKVAAQFTRLSEDLKSFLAQSSGKAVSAIGEKE